MECKLRGFSLNSRSRDQLNFDILKKNVQEEVNQLQPLPREIPVWNLHKIARDAKDEHLQVYSIGDQSEIGV